MPELHTESVGLHFRPSEVKQFVNEELAVGDPLLLEREPGNQYDSNAIKVLIETVDEDGVEEDLHIGYVPKTSNAVLAALMDQDAAPNLRASVFSFVGKNPQILIEWDEA